MRTEGNTVIGIRRKHDTMKKEKINETELERFCKFCQHSSDLTDGEKLLCEKKGIVCAEYVCKKFLYDPLKREPKRFSKEIKLEYVEL